MSTSTENLTPEERYVLKFTPRIEPQGQENFQTQQTAPSSENRFSAESQSSGSSSTPTQPCRYGQTTTAATANASVTASSNRSMSEARNPIFVSANSNRNSLKETPISNSNRSSMDVSTCSYNTLIIHNDDSLYGNSSINNNNTASMDFGTKVTKDRPRSFGTMAVTSSGAINPNYIPHQGDQQQQQHHLIIKEISEMPDDDDDDDDDYLSQSTVLKHLAKEINLPAQQRRSNQRDSGEQHNSTHTSGSVVMDSKEGQPPKYQPKCKKNSSNNSSSRGCGDQSKCTTTTVANNKLKSKSQPDLSRIIDIDLETIEALMKENVLLKQQLNTCYMKVAKTQKVRKGFVGSVASRSSRKNRIE